MLYWREYQCRSSRVGRKLPDGVSCPRVPVEIGQRKASAPSIVTERRCCDLLILTRSSAWAGAERHSSALKAAMPMQRIFDPQQPSHGTHAPSSIAHAVRRCKGFVNHKNPCHASLFRDRRIWNRAAPLKPSCAFNLTGGGGIV